MAQQKIERRFKLIKSAKIYVSTSRYLNLERIRENPLNPRKSAFHKKNNPRKQIKKGR
ncbi:MAG: hypothetical protein FWG87_00515 [Defluviitaleaceae bacterium]|nr:hypothetical protein [Defluviitaleaceae bacterium]